MLVGYCYTGEVEITSENILDLLGSASLLNFVKIEKKCKQFLEKQLTSKPELWLEIYQIAEQYSFSDLMDVSICIVCSNFESIAQTIEFCDMEFACLERILEGNYIYGTKEERIFEAAMKWVNFAEDREQFIPKILKMIRLVRIDKTVEFIIFFFNWITVRETFTYFSKVFKDFLRIFQDFSAVSCFS